MRSTSSTHNRHQLKKNACRPDGQGIQLKPLAQYLGMTKDGATVYFKTKKSPGRSPKHFLSTRPKTMSLFTKPGGEKKAARFLLNELTCMKADGRHYGPKALAAMDSLIACVVAKGAIIKDAQFLEKLNTVVDALAIDHAEARWSTSTETTASCTIHLPPDLPPPAQKLGPFFSHLTHLVPGIDAQTSIAELVQKFPALSAELQDSLANALTFHVNFAAQREDEATHYLASRLLDALELEMNAPADPYDGIDGADFYQPDVCAQEEGGDASRRVSSRAIDCNDPGIVLPLFGPLPSEPTGTDAVSDPYADIDPADFYQPTARTEWHPDDLLRGQVTQEVYQNGVRREVPLSALVA